MALLLAGCPAPVIDEPPALEAELDEEAIGERHVFILDLYRERLEEAAFIYRSLERSYTEEGLSEDAPELLGRFSETRQSFAALGRAHAEHLSRLRRQGLEPHPFVHDHMEYLEEIRATHQLLALEHDALMIAHDRALRTDIAQAHQALRSRHQELAELAADMLFFAPEHVETPPLPEDEEGELP